MNRDQATAVLIVGDGLQAYMLAEKLRLNGISSIIFRKEKTLPSQTLTSQCYLHSGHFYRSPGLVSDLKIANKLWIDWMDRYDIEVVRQKCVVLLEKAERDQWVNEWEAGSLNFTKVTKSSSHPLSPSDRYEMYGVNAKWINGAKLVNSFAQLHSQSIICGHIEKIDYSENGCAVVYKNQLGRSTIMVSAVVFASGIGNAALINTVEPGSKSVQQNRKCQIVVLEGKLPFYSAVVPTDGLFIVPLVCSGDVKWLCTFGPDPVAELDAANGLEEDNTRRNECLNAIDQTFPWFKDQKHSIRCGVIPTWKAESALDGMGQRPDSFSIHRVSTRVFAVWPTKLTLIPLATEKLVQQLSPLLPATIAPIPDYIHEANAIELF